ncbi:MAG: glycosyltransferase family 4 protein [Isosphaeraceae bacterium]
MKHLRICHLGKYYPPAPGGIETHVRTLARAQADLDVHVQVFCVNHTESPTVTEADGAVEVVRFRRARSALKLDYCPGLLTQLRQVEADILHLHVPNPTMILNLLAARPTPPVVVTYHSDVVNQKLRAALFRPLERMAYRRVRAILPTSPVYPQGSPFLQEYADRIQVLPIGIDVRPYVQPSAENLARAAEIREQYAQGGPLWLCTGRFVYYKGFINAVRALRHVEGRLLLIGDGPNQPELQLEARRLGVADRVVFLGRLPSYLDIVPYYLAVDAFWFPSNARSEAFGLVQVEAMASGCPVINTEIPHSGVPWVSSHEETGLTVPVNDPQAIASAARRLLSEPGLRERLIDAARRRAVEEFDHRVMAERSLAIYRRVLAGADVEGEKGRTSLIPSHLY